MNKLTITNLFLLTNFFLLAILCCCNATYAQTHDDEVIANIGQLQSKVRELESKSRQVIQNQRKLLDESGGLSLVLLLFGTVCALWAQNTGRNPWLWFFLGFFLSFIIVFFLLSKNAADLRRKRRDLLLS